MNKITFFVFFTVLSFSESTFAYTECTNLTITQVFNDSENTYILTGGLNQFNGVISSTLAEYKTMVSIAIAARMPNAKAHIRYKNDNVVCGSAAWDEEIIGIGV